MKFYAIGFAGKSIRTIVNDADGSGNAPRLNHVPGEVWVEVENKDVRGTISKDGKSFIAAGIDMDGELAKIRQRRTELLGRCDYTVLPDSTFTPAERENWTAYRSALRDITTDQPGKTFDAINWPTPPSSN